ncbi:uncharacterized protein LOC108624646 isoform X2 [Ceratina calcarata]|uniref:Uncharacterized protein LOC108624646 isoform X2 n=1 Tax=Ceratina calcarata TaxID=156304 RepID=A0AAJ7S1L2_9HYME|nr:uncharacterized protein LOC108624646 isoform X2 [Ceratina calcarata]
MMAVCMFWLLTYVGQGLDLAVGNRPVIVPQDQQDYRHGGIRRKSELNSVGNNLLLLNPDASSRRDDLSNWLLLNEEMRMSSWTPYLPFIDDMMRDSRETMLFAPAMMNVLNSKYANTGTQPGEPVGGPLLSPRGKKLRIDCRHSKNMVSLPIILLKQCDEETGRRSVQAETRQSLYDDLFDQKMSTIGANLKTDPNSKQRDYQNGPAFLPRLPFGFDRGKRGQMPVGRRSIAVPGESNQHLAQPPSSPGNGINIASQLMLRSIRGSIQFDVPQIECPISDEGMERFACPTADRMGRYHCIDDHALCDGFIDCPTGEDEDRQACMFYKTTKAHLDVLADAILRWARGR